MMPDPENGSRICQHSNIMHMPVANSRFNAHFPKFQPAPDPCFRPGEISRLRGTPEPTVKIADYQLPRTRSLAFSAIIIVGAFGFDPTRLGIAELSHIRIPSSPRTRNCGSTTAISSMPILHVQVG